MLRVRVLYTAQFAHLQSGQSDRPITDLWHTVVILLSSSSDRFRISAP
jgi:hypothetical protein